jgi:hypothetical protein
MRALILIGLLLGLAQPVDHSAFLPNPKLTPGDVLKVDLATLCTPGYTRTVRNVPVKIKRAVFAEYGIKNPQPGQYEVDHEVSLELGGSNSLANLWPEPYHVNVNGREMGAHEKDRLEDALHALVCKGRLTLAQGQGAIRGDWTKAYRMYVTPEFPPFVAGSHSHVEPAGK